LERNLDEDLPCRPNPHRRGASAAIFSPDGYYLAIARENNIAQVVDSRFDTADIRVCAHGPAMSMKDSDGREDSGYGVTALAWIDGGAGRDYCRNILLTGGEDGECS
jgi:hypothetical protein